MLENEGVRFMDPLIIPSEITGGSVYGVTQVEYNVAGEAGRNFIDAVTLASFIQATAIEDATSAYSRVVEARQRKINELSEALSYIAKANGSLDSKGGKSTDKVTVDNADYVKRVAAKYEINLIWESGNQMTRGNIQKAHTDFQYAIDKEDNDIQQDIVTLQSYITKRDNAYTNASKLVKKANQTAASTIGNIGA